MAQRIEAAAQRLLNGEVPLDPRRSAPAQLAAEAGVNRPRLYDTYSDLREAFEKQVSGHGVVTPGAPTRSEEALEHRIQSLESELRDTRARLSEANSEISNRKNANDQFMRIINLVEREKQMLEGRLSDAERRRSRDAETIATLRKQIMDIGGALDRRDVTPLRVLADPPEDRVIKDEGSIAVRDDGP